MDLDEFLARHGLDLPSVAEDVCAKLQLAGDDVLFAAGSLVEGLGNEKSDVDLLLVTSRPDSSFSFTALNDVTLIVGNCVIDVRVMQRAAVDELVHRFNDWASQSRPLHAATGFAEDERRFLYRLRHGRPLFGAEGYRQLQTRIDAADLARHRLTCARNSAGTIQIDLAGFRSSGDPYSMLFAAQDVLANTVDALLAAHGYAVPISKWRLRLLEKLPDDWEDQLPGRRIGLRPRDVYLALHRAPPAPSPDLVLQHALRIVAFARRVFAWAEYRLLHPSSHATAAALTGRRSPGRPLPHLDVDVVVRYRDSQFELLRLNGTGEVFGLSADEYSIICLFDGETSREEASGHAGRLWRKRNGRAVVDEMLALVHRGDFTARGFVDEKALDAILRPQQKRPSRS
jgi:hypothetical protein